MRHVVLHGHIFKNAGTTLDWSLRKNFGDDFLDHRDDQPMLADGRGHLAQLLQAGPALRAVSSHHMTRDFPQLPEVALLPVYLLRHPLARMRSVYDFERAQQATTPGAIAAKEKSFRDYIAWRMQDEVRPVIRNYQSRYLSGQHAMISQQKMASHYFPVAIDTLASACLVGIVERYDESMVVLEERLKPFYPDIDLSYVAQNVSDKGDRETGQEAVVEALLAELGALQQCVIDNNSLDLALYQMACSRLQAHIDAIEEFPARLQAFRDRCPR